MVTVYEPYFFMLKRVLNHALNHIYLAFSMWSKVCKNLLLGFRGKFVQVQEEEMSW